MEVTIPTGPPMSSAKLTTSLVSLDIVLRMNRFEEPIRKLVTNAIAFLSACKLMLCNPEKKTTRNELMKARKMCI